MVDTNRSAPSATVVPVLIYADVGRAVDWLCDAFGFTERLRAPGRDGGVSHAQLQVAEGALMFLDAPADMPFGERQYTAEDPEGHRWVFSQHVNDVAPEAWGARVASGAAAAPPKAPPPVARRET